MFKATIVGNVTKDVDVRTIQKNDQPKQTVVNFSVAIKKRSEKDNTIFIDVEVWGKYAEVCAEILHKGSRVTVVGDVYTEEYDYRGDTRFKIKMKNPDIAFDRKSSGEKKSESESAEDLPSSADDMPF